MHALVAGGFSAVVAAWEAVRAECPTEELTLQHRARVLRSRTPLTTKHRTDLRPGRPLTVLSVPFSDVFIGILGT
jgi:hypothetical protein